jgi:hypothetical protein
MTHLLLSHPPPLTPEKGLLANPWSVGLVMLWMGPLALYRLVVGGDGYDEGAYATVCLISAWAGVSTMIIAYRCARRWYSPAASAAGAFAASCGSILWYYSMREGGFANAISAFACAPTVLAWLRAVERPDFARWMALGAAAGLAAMTDWATALLLIAPILGVVHLLFKAHYDMTQLVCYAVWTGSLDTPGDARADGSTTLDAPQPDARQRSRRGSYLVYISVYNGSWNDWHGSSTFSMRCLTSLAAKYALGLAALAEALIRRRHTLAMLFSVVAGVCVNAACSQR